MMEQQIWLELTKWLEEREIKRKKREDQDKNFRDELEWN